MQKWTSTNSLRLTRYLTIGVIFLCVAAAFCIPICTEWYDAVSGQEPIHNLLNVILYISDALGLISMWELNGMLKRISKQEIFTAENVKVLRVISWCCFGIAALSFFLAFFRMLAFFVGFAAGFFGMIMRVLKNVFELAVEMRQENDFTI